MAVRLYVGGLDTRTTERDLEDEFRRYGRVSNIWVARKPPGFAFIDFEDYRDAEDAVRRLDGHHGWRVEFSRKADRGRRGAGGPGAGRGAPRGGRELRCYECNEVGHLARDCRNTGGKPREGRRSRSRSPRRSPSPRDRSRSPRRSYSRSPSRSPRRSP